MCRKLFFIHFLSFAFVLMANAEPADMLAWYKLDGNALDSSGNGYDGIPTDTVVYIKDTDFGLVASFNGVDAAIETPVPMPVMTPDIDFTWAFWYKMSAGAGQFAVVIGNRAGGGPGQFIKFTPTGFEFYDDGNQGIDYDDFPEGEWMHHAVVKNGDILTYYRNGAVAGTSQPDNDPNAIVFWIGGDPVQGEFAIGEISDVQLYSSALTDGEVQLVMAGIPLIPDYGWWKLDEGEGDVAFDSSGNHNDGVIMNPAGGLGTDGSVWVDDPEHGIVASFGGDDAEGAYIDAGSIPAMTLENDFTWAFWAKINVGAGNSDVIVGNRNRPEGWPYEGTSDFNFIKFTANQFEYVYDSNNSSNINYEDLNAVPNTGVWIHHAVVKDANSLTYYRNGEAAGTSTAVEIDVINPFYIGGDPGGERTAGYISDVRLYSCALTADAIQLIMEGFPEGEASGPNPEDGAIEVPIDQVLSWEPGDYANTHNVYLGTDFDDVNDATTADTDLLVSPEQSGITYDPDDLDWGTTYYWRIDEVNDLNPDSPWRGPIWSFTTELYSYPIAADKITVTASSQFDANMVPEKTIDGSGLTSISHPIDTRDDVHSVNLSDMWLSSEDDAGPVWIQYDLDKPYKLDQMLVWNFNGERYLPMLGMKDVTIEYSTDGDTWMPFNDTEFTMATGQENYLAGITIPFDGLIVAGVRFTAASNWSGGIFRVSGLSEVDFLKRPNDASNPDPNDGATDVPVDPRPQLVSDK